MMYVVDDGGSDGDDEQETRSAYSRGYPDLLMGVIGERNKEWDDGVRVRKELKVCK